MVLEELVELVVQQHHHIPHGHLQHLQVQVDLMQVAVAVAEDLLAVQEAAAEQEMLVHLQQEILVQVVEDQQELAAMVDLVL